MRDDHRDPSCTGKRVYADKPTADRMARRTNNARDVRVAPYHCCKCHGWHVGEARIKQRRPQSQLED